MMGSLPLYGFFQALRKETNLSLGPAHYADLQQLLLWQKPENPEDVLDLCRLLWLQTPDEEPAFTRLFRQHWALEEQALHKFGESPVKEPPLLKDPGPIGSPIKEPAPAPPPATPPPAPDPVGPRLTPDPSTRYRDIWLEFSEGAETGEGISHDEKSLRLADHNFILTPKYMPLTPRHLQQSWRRLPNEGRRVPSKEIDPAASIEKWSRDRVLIEPVYARERTRRNEEALILLDFRGSMTPFEGLCDYLTENLREAIRPGKTSLLYFYNFPGEKLYEDKGQTRAVTQAEILKKLTSRTLVLFISDAGAARGFLNEERVTQTRRFLDLLRTKTRRLLWLNPLPQEQWFGASAIYISIFVEMLAATEEGMGQLSRTLQKL